MVKFCYCGLVLENNKCPRHEEKITKPIKNPSRGQFSGHSIKRDKWGYFPSVEGR